VAGRADPGDLLQKYSFVRWLSYLIVPAFAVLMVVRSFVRHQPWRRTGLEPFFALLTRLTVLSGLVNQTGFTAILLSLAIYLRYPLLFLVLYNLDLGTKLYGRFVRSLIWVALALIGEAIVAYLVFGKHGDQTFFSTGVNFGHVNAGLIFVYALCFLFAHALIFRWRWYHLAMIALVGVAAWIATIRSILVLLPLLPLAMWGVKHRLVGRRRLPQLALAGLLACVALAIVLGPKLLDGSVGFGIPRFAQLRLASVRDVLVNMTPANREWLGFGPRSFSPGTFGSAGEMYELEIRVRGLYWVNNFALSQLASGLSELGVLGFALYWLLLARTLQAVLRFRQEYLAAESDPARKQTFALLTLAFVGIWLHYALLGAIYYDVWRMDITSLVFWGTAAAIFSERSAFRRRQTRTPA